MEKCMKIGKNDWIYPKISQNMQQHIKICKKNMQKSKICKKIFNFCFIYSFFGSFKPLALF